MGCKVLSKMPESSELVRIRYIFYQYVQYTYSLYKFGILAKSESGSKVRRFLLSRLELRKTGRSRTYIIYFIQ